MSGNYTINTRVTGETITAVKYNADHQLHVDNNTPGGIDDYSSTVTQMQENADPGEVGSESLATSLAEELKRIRFTLKEITGKSQWYETPAITLGGAGKIASLSLTSNQTGSTGSNKVVNWTSEDRDDDDYFSTGQPSRLTAQAGNKRVMLSAGVQFQGAPGVGSRAIEIIKNGSTFMGGGRIETQRTSGASMAMSVMTAMISVVSGDYFELQEKAGNVTGAITVQSNDRTFFRMVTFG